MAYSEFVSSAANLLSAEKNGEDEDDCFDDVKFSVLQLLVFSNCFSIKIVDA